MPTPTETLSKKLQDRLETAKKIYEQQKYMYDNHSETQMRTRLDSDKVARNNLPLPRHVNFPIEPKKTGQGSLHHYYKTFKSEKIRFCSVGIN